ncbi:MAG: MBL fold metallo-hydrolase [Cognatishimia sp.]
MTHLPLTRRGFLGSLAAVSATAGLSLPLQAAETFSLGDGQIFALSDGTFDFPAQLWVGASDEEKAKLGEHVTIGANAFVYRRGERVFLIDAGAGNSSFITSRFQSVGRVPAELAMLGIAREDITDVVITHMHPDHVGGVIFDGERTFPNAKIHINAKEWAFWTRNGFATDAPEGMRDMVVSLQETAGMIEDAVVLQNGEADLGGVMMQPAFGHTPGHNVMMIDLGSERLLVLGDTVVSDHIHFENPSVGWALDADPAAAQATRRRLLDMAATDGLIVAANHVTAPGLGHVERAGDAYRFVPLG